MHQQRILKSHFANIIYTIPKSIVEIHEVKKNMKEEEIPKPILSKTHHILFQFPVKPEPEPDPIMEEDNTVEYIIDIGDVYTINDENEKNEYNPMYFSLRHYISDK